MLELVSEGGVAYYDKALCFRGRFRQERIGDLLILEYSA